METPRILPRILLLYKLLNSFLLTLIPKYLRSIFPPSWYDDDDDKEPDNRPTSSSSTIPPSTLVKTDPSSSSPPTTKPKTSATTTTTSSSSDPGGEVVPSATLTPRESGTDAAAELSRKVFRMFDGNGDGKITNDELKDSLESMGMSVPESELAQMITAVDADGDGCVDVDEFRVLYDTIVRRGGGGGEKGGGEEEEEDERVMLDAFGVFDRNGDGFISMEELGSVLCSLGLGQGGNVEDCRKMIMKVDVDGDGRVSFDEFKCMMRDCCFASC